MKILTWNVQWFKGLDGEVNIDRVIKKGREIGDFDVLCMQEVSINFKGLTGDTPADQVARVRALLPGYEVLFSPAVDQLSECGTYRQQFGNLIASRFPVFLVEKMLLPDPPSAGVASTPSMRRVCLVCTVQAPWGPVRVMTSHLEYHNAKARLAQACALRDLHLQACDVAEHPPKTIEGTPYQAKPHTFDAVLCGDFNFEMGSEEYSQLIQPGPSGSFLNAWDVVGAGRPYPATFKLFDRTYGPEPVGCDFFFVSPSLVARIKAITVDQLTQLSDHQPVLLELRD